MVVCMPREEQEWKKLTEHNGGGVVRISASDMQRLKSDSDLDPGEDMKYSTSTAVSEGRARVFVRLRNIEQPE